MELLIGCGNSREKKISRNGKGWDALVTMDINPDCEPDVLGDASDPEFPVFKDNMFDEVHAYDVLEHFGQQGDWRYFFAHWSGIWRILKPDGVFCGISPDVTSRWAWGDPGHSRIITPECLVFLSKAEYERQIGVTPMTDYRFVYKADFHIEMSHVDQDSLQHAYVLKAVK